MQKTTAEEAIAGLSSQALKPPHRVTLYLTYPIFSDQTLSWNSFAPKAFPGRSPPAMFRAVEQTHL